MLRKLFICFVLFVCHPGIWAQLILPEEFDSIPTALVKENNFDRLKSYSEEKKLRLEKEGKGESFTYAFTLLDLCSAKAALGDTNIDNELTAALNILEKSEPDWNSYWISIFKYESDLKNNNCREGVRLLKTRQLDYCKSKFGPKSAEYSNSLTQYVLFLINNSEFENLDRYCLEGLDASEFIEPSEVDDFNFFAMVLNNVYEMRRRQGDDGAVLQQIELGERQVNRTDRLKNVNIEDRIDQYCNLLHLYFEIENFEESAGYGGKALQIAENNYGRENDEYADIEKWYLLSLERLEGKEKVFAQKLANLQRRERLLNPADPEIAKTKRQLASDYSSIGLYEDAIRIVDSLLENEETSGSLGQGLYLSLIMDLASYKRDNENFSECIALYQKAVDIRKSQNDCMYVSPQYLLGSAYTKMGEYLKAIEIHENTLKEIDFLMPTLTGNERESSLLKDVKSACLSSLGSNYSFLGIKTKAALYQIENYRLMDMEIPAVVWRELEAEKEGRDYVYTDEDVAVAEELNSQYYADLVEYGLLNTTDHADYLFMCSSPFLLKHDYASAGVKMEEALAMYERLNHTSGLDYAGYLELYAMNLNQLGEKEKAIDSFRRALEIKQAKLPASHPSILDLKKRLAIARFTDGDESSAQSALDVSEGIRGLLIPLFAQLTSLERNMYWDKYKDWFLTDMNVIAARYPNDDLIESALDGILLSKGLLLNTDIEFSSLIKDSNNPRLLDKFYKMNSMRSELTGSQKLSPDEYIRKDLEIQEIEKELIAESKSYGDYTKNLDIRWPQIRQKLNRGSVALEFVSYPGNDSDTHYAVFVISPDSQKPLMVNLFAEKELDRIPTSGYYTNSGLSRLVWSKLDEFLENKEDIYFSPSGSLYNIAIEYLPHYKRAGTMADHHRFHRLSSTRQLAVIRENADYKDAALYGGMIYDTDPSFLTEDMKKYPRKHSRDFLVDLNVDSEALRDGASDLPETETEVINIGKHFDKSNIKPLIFKGLEGSEASFKSLSGKNINLIHIATHGFYWTEPEASDAIGLTFLTTENSKKPYYVEDKSLTRSGLLFSGANNILTGNPIPEDVEDGVLTAKEISQLDLRKLDMVVLSACQTGLGEITGDGVFGLQRGFKKAGANSLLMSLWKVDDRATQMLMTKFYEEFLAGKSKHDALKSARRCLMEYEEEVEDVDPAEMEEDDNMTASQKRKAERLNGSTDYGPIVIKPYADPKFWAAFILLDAID